MAMEFSLALNSRKVRESSLSNEKNQRHGKARPLILLRSTHEEEGLCD